MPILYKSGELCYNICSCSQKVHILPGERERIKMEHRKMKSLPAGESPDEKAGRYGISTLSNAELLAVILRSGTKDASVVHTCYRLLEHMHGISGLLNPENLQKSDIPGIGRVKLLQLSAVSELSKRLSEERSVNRLNCSDPESVYAYYKDRFRHLPQEEVRILLLDTHLKRIRDILVNRGTVNRSLISPKDIFRTAVTGGAAAFLLMHNHPSGDPLPSDDDIRITKRIRELGEMMELPMVDHIIFGEDRYYSFSEQENTTL